MEEYTIGNFKADVNGILKVARRSLGGLKREQRKPFEVEICYIQDAISRHTSVYYEPKIYKQYVVPLVHELLDVIEQINTAAGK